MNQYINESFKCQANLYSILLGIGSLKSVAIVLSRGGNYDNCVLGSLNWKKCIEWTLRKRL